MNDRVNTGMAEAARLARAGQLSEATAIIKRMLRGMLAGEASPNAPDCTSDEPIDVTLSRRGRGFGPMEVSAQEWDDQASSPAVPMPSPADVAVASVKRPYTNQTLRDEHGVALSIIQSTLVSVRARVMPGGSGGILAPALRFPLFGVYLAGPY